MLVVIVVNLWEILCQIQKWIKMILFKMWQGLNYVQRCMEVVKDVKSNMKKVEMMMREVKKDDEKGEMQVLKDVIQNCYVCQVQGMIKKDLQVRKKFLDMLQRLKKISKVNNFLVFIIFLFIFILCVESLCVFFGVVFDISFFV